ncbi:universal stress protein [Luteimonas sp. JM171]|uniref:universal stress protein n=1 Tax=Luteimonas sp. JM171 TaxID=1896164 RepID=UPI0008578CCC|nr:universal stress protein [Luteimonas sp. JM171]AOH36016.1 hypothetical protein BGP89_06305 [Luteimonas sp. JM171]
MFKHLLLPTDGSPLSARAIDQGLRLAQQLGAHASIVTVLEPLRAFNASSELLADVRESFEKSSREAADRTLQAAADQAAALGVPATTTVVTGSQPHRQIIEAAGEGGCDLIVMASHGRRGVSGLLVGSVTQKVLTHSSVPVLVIRGDER